MDDSNVGSGDSPLVGRRLTIRLTPYWHRYVDQRMKAEGITATKIIFEALRSLRDQKTPTQVYDPVDRAAELESIIVNARRELAALAMPKQVREQVKDAATSTEAE